MAPSAFDLEPGTGADAVPQPAWTLRVRCVADGVEYGLSDGRRLATRALRRSVPNAMGAGALPAARVFGSELAARLAGSATRALHLQLDESLDAIAWEAISLGAACLGERFAVARQVLGDADAGAVPAPPLVDALTVTVVGAGRSARHPQSWCVSLDALDRPGAGDTLARSHVVVLDGVTPAQLLHRARLPRRQRLFVLNGPQPLEGITSLLDEGAAVLCVPPHSDLRLLKTLHLQLEGGATVGEAARRLHKETVLPNVTATRLYGDPSLRFVRTHQFASHRQVTSLSVDLVASTALMQQLGDEDYADTLAQVHARCSDVVRQHGGQPDDPQGDDGVMSYFGHPVAIEDAATRAVRAGLQIVRTVAELGMSVRVGVATGLVAVRAGQPVGLSIHLAARLQQATMPGTVLISQATQQLVGLAFETAPLANRPALKGIDTAGDCYLVLGPSRNARLHPLDRAPWLTPFVGREPDLARLVASWHALPAGQCRAVVVRGEAGIGKSRLLREFRRWLVGNGAKVLECRCRADASASPLLALAEAINRWLGVDAGAPDAGALRKLAAALPASARSGEPFALVAALLGLAPQPAQADPAHARKRLLELLLEWFEHFALDRPCCLAVEDWHWVDPTMADFVGRLLERRGGTALLVVITTRDGAAPLPSGGQVDPIELGGLAHDAACELVARVRAPAALPPGLVRSIAARGDGVPLFLEEATRMAHELGPDRLAQQGSGADAVPASLHDLLMARLDAVSPAKPVAQVAAVLGREFSLPMLSALLENGRFACDAESLAARLALLQASGLLRAEDGGRYAFKHALVRDTAYGCLWARDRSALHARMVDLLRTRWPELVARQPELLAHHQTEAGLHAEALAQWELAARHAAARSAEHEAISHLRRALALLGHEPAGAERDRTALRLQLMLAARLIVTEGYGADTVMRAYADAAPLCDALGDDAARFKVEMGLESYRFMRADFDAALEHGRKAAVIAVASGDTRQRLHAHWGLACTLFHQGKLRATMRELELGLALYKPDLHRLFGVQDPGVMCMAYSSWGLWERARPDAAVTRIEHAIELSRAYEHKFSQAVALAYGVSIYLLRGESDIALERADACIAVCEKAGFPVWLAITRCMRGRLLCERGDIDTGLAEMRAGHALWLATGSMVSQPLYLALQAEGLALAGDTDAALACVDDGLAIAARYGERQYEAELRRLRGELALQCGEPREEAEAWIAGGHALALRQHRLGFALRSATSLARLWAERGHRARARRLVATLLARWSEGQGTRDVCSARGLIDSLA